MTPREQLGATTAVPPGTPAARGPQKVSALLQTMAIDPRVPEATRSALLAGIIRSSLPTASAA